VNITLRFSLSKIFQSIGAAITWLCQPLGILGSVAVKIFGAIVSVLVTIGRVIGNVFMGLVNMIGQCLAFMMQPIIAFGAGVAARLVGCFSWIVGGIWGLVQQVGTVLASAVDKAFSVVQGALASVWNRITQTFSSAFQFIGNLVSGFGNFFLGVFQGIGTAVEWLREQFGNLCSSAVEVYGAIVAALGRGDIEAAK